MADIRQNRPRGAGRARQLAAVETLGELDLAATPDAFAAAWTVQEQAVALGLGRADAMRRPLDTVDDPVVLGQPGRA